MLGGQEYAIIPSVTSPKSPWALRPELELLLRCTRPNLDPARSGRIQELLHEELDWLYLLQCAQAHRLLPLLYWNLKTACPAAVPPAVLHQLRDYFHTHARFALMRTAELLKLLHVFEAEGISAVPYKGPLLAKMAYGNLVLRQFSDLDILFHQRDVPRVQELLVAQGYQPEFRFNPAQSAAFLRYDCEHPFLRDADNSVVEVHWRFEPWHFSFPLDLDRLRDRLIQVSLQNTVVPTFKPEDLILILSVHGAKHLWNRLAWICDIAALIASHPKMDWQEVQEQAKTFGVERMLLLSLLLASRLAGAELPQGTQDRASRDSVVRMLAHRVSTRFSRGITSEPGLWDYSLFHLWARERSQDRARYLVRRIITTSWEDWAMLPLPSRLFPLYYLLRPVLLAIKVYRYARYRGQGIINRGGHLSKHWSVTPSSAIEGKPSHPPFS